MPYQWHNFITSGRNDLNDVGYYRTHEEPMQIISGPSSQVKQEMNQFMAWFQETAPTGANSLPALTKLNFMIGFAIN